MSDSLDPVDVVQRFWISLQTGDAKGAGALLAGDVVWRNSGLPTVRGARVSALLIDLERRGVVVEVEMHHIAAQAHVVLTDRTDTIRAGALATSFPVQGTFEVRNGLITRWEDHFTWGSVALASVSSVAETLTWGLRSVRDRAGALVGRG